MYGLFRRADGIRSNEAFNAFLGRRLVNSWKTFTHDYESECVDAPVIIVFASFAFISNVILRFCISMETRSGETN